MTNFATIVAMPLCSFCPCLVLAFLASFSITSFRHHELLELLHEESKIIFIIGALIVI
uniref:Uncharacterized protein n=1 Tax=Arundo donax TaxID=35708 RepID=A0A0A9T0T0_ARUDO